VAVLAAATLWVAPSWVADLGPIPDALEYAVTAQRLAAFEPFGLLLLGHEYPSRYPFGFPALMAPAYWLPDATLAHGILLVVAAGVATVVLASGLARRIGGPVAGIAAALTLLLRPSFLDWNHQIMTETVSAALTVAVALLLHRAAAGDEPERRRDLLLIGGDRGGDAGALYQRRAGPGGGRRPGRRGQAGARWGIRDP
jgi:4-amino-4-deoxy-L-arabinose transferase-like glycosyltransferase